MKTFKYNVVKLIECVRARECLWNRDLEVYKDRVERRNAWEEIFAILDENYEQMTAEEKRVTGEKIINKWTNIRDTFVKSLKPNAGKLKRKYIYYDNLEFLIKFLVDEEYYNSNADSNFYEYTSNYKADETSADETAEPKTKKQSKKYNNEDIPSTSKKRKKSVELSPNTIEEVDDSCDGGYEYAIDHVDVNEDTRSDPRIMNEDEAFFASLLPTVVKYSEDERLEFRIEVLNVMKKIRDSKKWT